MKDRFVRPEILRDRQEAADRYGLQAQTREMTMRHEFTRHCITLGSALAMGLLTLTANAQAQQAEEAPKQKALIAFKLDLLSRFKKDEKAADAEPAPPASEVMPVSAVEPLPSESAKTNAIAAANTAPTLQLPAAESQERFPSVLPPSAPPVQLTSGQFPLPAAAGQMPFQSAQSPVVIMMPAGWQPDGSYTFAPRTVMSPEAPAEHWPSSHRNPLGDDTRKGLFDWPQIAKKITNSTVGEPDIKPRAPEPAPSTSRALFAGTETQTAPASSQASPAQPQALPAVTQDVHIPAPAEQLAVQAAPAAELNPAAVQPSAVQPAAKALFAPKPEPQPQPEQSKTRALFSLLAKPMNKPEAVPANAAGSKALFAFGQKKGAPAVAPAPAVVPQYASEMPMPPEQSMPTLTPTTTVESSDPELQPPAPPSVANPLPGKLHTVKSDDPKMKWRAKGAPAQVVEHAAAPTDAASESEPRAVAVQATEAATPADDQAATTTMIEEPAAAPAAPAISQQPAHQHAQHQLGLPVVETTPAPRERSLLGKHFPTMAAQTPRNTNDGRSPWRRQAERDAIAAAEKKIEQPVANSKAILPNVTAMLPAVEKPSRPVHQHTKSSVATVAATEDTVPRSHPVQRAHESSARSTDSYYADPWENEVEAELDAIERRQIGATSNRRAAIAGQSLDREAEPVARQPRVPFEVDELEQEKAALRRSAKTSKPTPKTRARSSSPAGSPSNGARMAEQQSKKGYRRLTGGDVKQNLTRPLALFSDITKLPSPLKTAADSFDRRRNESMDDHPRDAENLDPSSSEQYESAGMEEGFEEDDYVEEPLKSVKPKRSAAKREPVHELRQSTAAAASVTEQEDEELLTSDDSARPASLGQRGGRRQVERTARPSRTQQDFDDREEADSGVVTADDAAIENAAEEDTDAEFDDERPVRPATHIRNKHGNRVKIFTGDVQESDAQESDAQ